MRNSAIPFGPTPEVALLVPARRGDSGGPTRLVLFPEGHTRRSTLKVGTPAADTDTAPSLRSGTAGG